jgi:beta-glucosidase
MGFGMSSSSADFGDDFTWGVATASYQIEGGVDEGGRGVSVWDTFSHTPGKISTGETGDVACDSYHRWRDDVALLARLGADAYRFSIAWPRIQPTGRGAVNAEGLAYYDRLVDALLAAGVEPVPTLFHWDTPQALEDDGGWLVRETAYRFAEYADVVGRALGDRVHRWITVNEPFVHMSFGYALGLNAPGQMLLSAAFPAGHHLLLGHGLAVEALRGVVLDAQVGITNNYGPVVPTSDDRRDVAAAAILDALHNHMFTDPVLFGAYPDLLNEYYANGGMDGIADGDLSTISTPIDFLGVNYYNPDRVGRPSPGNPLGFELAPPDPAYATTGFGWPIVPEAFRELLTGLHARYGERLPPILVTENGAAFDDMPDAGGRVDDPDRIDYLRSHIAAVHDAMAAGVDVRGYFVWTLLDNFEWSEGTSQRFGIVRTDFDTLERIPKASFDWYRSWIARGE